MTQQRIHGFTLIELIVSIAAIALMSVVLSQVFFTTLRTNTKTEILKDVKQNGELAQGVMVRLIQNAQKITSGCDDTGVTSQSIAIEGFDGATTTFGCVEDGTSMRLASVSASYTDYLTSANVTLGGASCATSSIVFICKGGVGSPSTVSISFSLAQKGAPVDQFEKSSASFQTSVITRSTWSE